MDRIEVSRLAAAVAALPDSRRSRGWYLRADFDGSVWNVVLGNNGGPEERFAVTGGKSQVEDLLTTVTTLRKQANEP